MIQGIYFIVWVPTNSSELISILFILYKFLFYFWFIEDFFAHISFQVKSHTTRSRVPILIIFLPVLSTLRRDFLLHCHYDRVKYYSNFSRQITFRLQFNYLNGYLRRFPTLSRKQFVFMRSHYRYLIKSCFNLPLKAQVKQNRQIWINFFRNFPWFITASRLWGQDLINRKCGKLHRKTLSRPLIAAIWIIFNVFSARPTWTRVRCGWILLSWQNQKSLVKRCVLASSISEHKVEYWKIRIDFYSSLVSEFFIWQMTSKHFK